MFAADGALVVILGSLGGIAALIGGINSWVQRKHTGRMNVFEASQTSMQAALTRCDVENERLRDEVNNLREEVKALKVPRKESLDDP